MPTLAAAKASNASLKLASPVGIFFGASAPLSIGAALALKLASYSSGSPDIHIVGRDASSASECISQLKTVNPNGTYTFHKCDLSLVSETKELASKLQSIPKINFVVFAQGMLSMKSRTETSEGNDVKMMLHLYSRALLAKELSPVVARAAEAGEPARVMSVLDATRSNIANVDFDDLDLRRTFSISKAATHCIAMNDVFLQHLAKEYPSVGYFHAYPGFVATSIARGLPAYVRAPLSLVNKVLAVPPPDCAEYLLSAFANPKNATGFYSVNNKGDVISNVPKASEQQAKTIWEHVCSIIA